MGITAYDITILDDIIDLYKPQSVIELGSQQLYDGRPWVNGKAPYADEYYKQKGLLYECIDLNGENKAWVVDLGNDHSDLSALYGELHFLNNGFHLNQADLVSDFGTSEHVGHVGHFCWQGIYNCWKIKFDLCKEGGIIISENPLTGNWPDHGFNFYTEEFYYQLERNSHLKILTTEIVCAMGNCETGKNVLCIMKKYGSVFPNIETFMTFDLRQA